MKRNQDLEKEMQRITSYVHNYRKANNIQPTHGSKMELSCYAFGEGHNLLYRQLIPTIDNDGCWDELDDPVIRRLVLDEIDKQENKKKA